MSLSTLGEYLFGKNEEDLYIWQDRELRFDCMPKDIVCRPGEEVIQQLVSNSKDSVALTVWCLGSAGHTWGKCSRCRRMYQ